MIVLGIEIYDQDITYDTIGLVLHESRKLLHWTHWFFGSYTTTYLYMRDVTMVFDVNFYVIYRWKKDEEGCNE